MIKKYIIFDLDETLGFFTELSVIWSCLQKIYNVNGQKSFDELCQLFEKEYFRPGIFETLNYLKQIENSVNVVLYTNNTGSLMWLRHIISFLERRSNAKGLFNKIVPGFRPNLTGPYDRRTFNKTYDEILRCAEIPSDAKIIFFDDVAHPGMIHKNVTYIKVRPFSHPMRSSYIVEKLQKSYFGFIDYGTTIYIQNSIRRFHHEYAHYMKHCGNTRVVKNDIFVRLRRFMKDTKKTMKKKQPSNNKTKKNY